MATTTGRSPEVDRKAAAIIGHLAVDVIHHAITRAPDGRDDYWHGAAAILARRAYHLARASVGDRDT